MLDGLVGDGELTQVVADHLLGSFLTHGTSEEYYTKKKKTPSTHTSEMAYRLDLHRDVLLAVVHTHHAA